MGEGCREDILSRSSSSPPPPPPLPLPPLPPSGWEKTNFLTFPHLTLNFQPPTEEMEKGIRLTAYKLRLKLDTRETAQQILCILTNQELTEFYSSFNSLPTLSLLFL